MTACLLGLAFGQVVAGPLSDRFGRRRPLLIGVAAYIAASVLCAFAPTIETLIAARLVQGLAGAVGIVIAQAAGRDLFAGGRLMRYYGRLTVLGGLAAIIGPVIGGQLAKVTDWRGTFVFPRRRRRPHPRGQRWCAPGDAATCPTTHWRARRQRARVPPPPRRPRLFWARSSITGFANAAIFAYLSGATFVLQDVYGLSPQGYSFAFGLNSLGFMVFGFIAGRSSERWSPHGVLAAGLAMVLAGAAGVLATGAAQLPLPAIVISLFIMVSGVAVTTPPTIVQPVSR